MALDGSTLAPFFGDVDIEKLIETVPSGHTIKGAFVASNAAIVANVWPRVECTLKAPPRGGKYLSFSDYPVADFLRVSDAAARLKYPSVPTRESHRLLSRRTFETFAATTLGRVTLTLISGPASLLTKYEEIFNRMVSGPRVSVRVVEKDSVELDYTGYYSVREAIFGVLEGAVLACNCEPRVSVNRKGDGRYLATVTWVGR
jgi:uncharacterized protein (TIGR02265 family)